MQDNMDNSYESFDPDAVIRRVLERQHKELERDLFPKKNSSDLATNLLSAHKAGEVEVNSVRNTKGEAINDIQWAPEMHIRHMRLLQREAVAAAMYNDFLDKGHRVRYMRNYLEKNGGFFEDLSLEECERRLADASHWVISRAGGEIRSKEKEFDWTEFRYVAGMQVQIPDDDKNTPLVTKIPSIDSKESFYPGPNYERARGIAKMIHENHAIAACITDVEVWPEEYRNKRIASLARQKAIEHIKAQINSLRANKIQWLIANMFHIRGMQIDSGSFKDKKLIIMNGKNENPIINKISIYMHAFSQKIDSLLAWKISGDNIPVQFESETGEKISGEILMDWDTALMKI